MPVLEDEREDAVGAPTDSRLSTIALIGTTIDRNVTSSSTNASPSTNANTIGRRDLIVSLKSFEPAVMPVTLTSAPGTAPIVCGTTSSRSAASAASDFASVPSPASGMSTIARSWRGLVVT